MRYDCSHAGCPSRDVLALIANKWTVLVLGVLLEGTARFNQLRRRVDGVWQKVLTETLRELERRGLVARKIFAEVPLAAERRFDERRRVAAR